MFSLQQIWHCTSMCLFSPTRDEQVVPSIGGKPCLPEASMYRRSCSIWHVKFLCFNLENMSSSPPENISTSSASSHSSPESPPSPIQYNGRKRRTSESKTPYTSTDSDSNASCEDTIHIDNDSSTSPLFQFHMNGNKTLKDGSVRKYYYCNVKDCKAQYTETTLKGNKETVYISFHNHTPAENPRCRKQAKVKALEYLKVGITPAAVQKHMVNSAQYKSDVVTQSQVRQWKHRMVMADMPSGNEHINITY